MMRRRTMDSDVTTIIVHNIIPLQGVVANNE